MQKEDFEAKTTQTYDVIAKTWARSHTKTSEWETEIGRFNQLLPSGTILEIGSGGGRDAAELLKHQYDYLGTDVSAGMVRAARATVPEATFRQLNVYDLATLGTKFDGFWASAVLLHIPKARIDEALQAINASLKPGAIGMISLKDGTTEDFEVRDKEGMHQERLFVYWRKDDFLEVLNRNGFVLLEYTYRPISQRTNWHIFFVAKKSSLQ